MAGAALFALASGRAPASVAPNAGPDAHELSNLDVRNIAPKSSPAAMARVFKDSCPHGPQGFAAAEAGLRKAGFVPMPGDGGMVAFVSDDRRPMVLVNRNGRSCAVGAMARTGQTDRLRRLVAERFPKAVAVDVAALGQPGLEAAWRIEDGILYLQRVASPFNSSRLIFGIWRTT